MGTLRRWRPGERSQWLVLAGVLILAIGILTAGVLTVKDAYPLLPTTLTTGGLSLPISTSVSLPVSDEPTDASHYRHDDDNHNAYNDHDPDAPVNDDAHDGHDSDAPVNDGGDND